MASPEELAASLKRGQVALNAATVRDAAALWSLLTFTDLTRTYPAWEAAMRRLIARNRATAATLGAAYVREAHALDARGPLTMVRAGALPAAQVATALRVTSLVAFRTALGAGLTAEAASRSALVQTSGATSRLVLDATRSTVAESATASGGRWTRIPSGSACSFCRMLAGRGAVYRTGVNFASHDHCGCSMAASFGVAPPVSYVPSERRISDADRARVRSWLQANPDAA